MKQSVPYADLIQKGVQFVIPAYQRNYDWNDKRREELWEDILEIACLIHRSPERRDTHFMGVFVATPAPTSLVDIQRGWISDGQQRFTTLQVLLIALRDKAAQEGQKELAAEIRDYYLTNPYKKGDDIYKILHKGNTVDREAFKALHGERQQVPGTVTDAYLFFKSKLDELRPDQPEEALGLIKMVIGSRLTFVELTLEPWDNQYTIFQKLNATPKPLTPGDLIRSYFFGTIPYEVHKHDAIEAQWLSIQTNVGDTTDFLFHFLTMEAGRLIKRTDIYAEFKNIVDRKDESEILSFLDKAHRHSDYYKRLLQPEYEAHAAIRGGLEVLNRMELTVAYPFLLSLYEGYEEGMVTEASFTEILRTIENVLVRRYVCGIQRADLSTLFVNLYSRARRRAGDFTTKVKQALGKRNYPSNDEFHTTLVHKPLYRDGEGRTRVKFILERLEEAEEHKELVPFSDKTIEHVMPQDFTPWWTAHLGEDGIRVHQALLHTLGNLTLTAYNSEMSNADFYTKKVFYGSSHLELNLAIAKYPKWSEVEILARGESLAAIALRIWPDIYPDRTSDISMKGTRPESLDCLGETTVTRSWQAVVESTFNIVSRKAKHEHLADISRHYPEIVHRKSLKMARAVKMAHGYYYDAAQLDKVGADRAHTIAEVAAMIVGGPTAQWSVKVAERNDPDKDELRKCFVEIMDYGSEA